MTRTKFETEMSQDRENVRNGNSSCRYTKRTITCIECPMGCAVETETENGVVTRVSGNGCPRGKAYAESEAICPVRVLTSTVRSVSGKMVPVKTSKPVRKSALFALMQTVNAVHPPLPVHIGDVLVRGIEGDADLVATGEVQV